MRSVIQYSTCEVSYRNIKSIHAIIYKIIYNINKNAVIFICSVIKTKFFTVRLEVTLKYLAVLSTIIKRTDFNQKGLSQLIQICKAKLRSYNFVLEFISIAIENNNHINQILTQDFKLVVTLSSEVSLFGLFKFLLFTSKIES